MGVPGLRILSDSQDLAYFEFTDPYSDWSFNAPSFFELYNISQDPDQLHNIYHSVSAALQQDLADRMQKQYSCAGPTCE